ncbi:hypothetical protein RRG08_036591 [Elysia crispata]|uniref:Uncharacterized protein n=1 Tax=Elysia crispata TaxID=231223 RepID=A0AAE0ZRX5_9GAST|nr:hypothetical protein RRG08_036591 [Elysia crispata]
MVSHPKQDHMVPITGSDDRRTLEYCAVTYLLPPPTQISTLTHLTNYLGMFNSFNVLLSLADQLHIQDDAISSAP